MKGKVLKLACLAGAIFLLCMLPSCSLFDTISGVWDGRISLEIDFDTYGTEDSDVDARITLEKRKHHNRHY